MIIQKCTFTPILIDSRFLRKGILIKLTDDQGKTASAEVSPLPGNSSETIEDALMQLRLLERQITTTWWTKQTLEALKNLSLYPSVHFGVESALLDLLDPIEEASSTLKYALLLGSPSEIEARADEVYSQGFRQAKVKLGHLSLEDAIQIVEKLTKRFHLRIDLNQKWPLGQTLALCKQIPGSELEYIEEPAKDPKELLDFPFPFALDETLRQGVPLAPFLKLKALKALIVKPTLLYPFTPLLSLGKRIVLTSSFEGTIGIRQIERLSRRHHLHFTYHGLDSLRYFETPADYEPVPHYALETATR